MKNVIIDPGIIPHHYVLSALKETNFKVTVISDKENVTYVRDSNATECFYYSEFRNLRQNRLSEEARAIFNDVFEYVISDYRTLQLAERVNIRFYPWINDFNDLMLISNLVSNFLELIIEKRPLFVFFHTTPHGLYTWTLGKVAEYMGITVYKTVQMSLFWKCMLSEGLAEPRLIPLKDNIYNGVSNDYVQQYIELNKKSYDEAIPSYERERIVARKGKFWSWRKEIKNCFIKPKIKWYVYYFCAMFMKYNLYKYYQKISDKSVDLRKNYFVVFLHYQPERTSMPEGRYFAQQYQIIKTIREGLPEDCFVYIKEHPSTFMNEFDIRYREKNFYNQILMLKNVRFVDIGMNSFDLIDNSLGVATITGTVGTQALIRGKAVLCFGDASYVDFKHCYNIRDINDVEDAYKSIIDNSDDISQMFKDYLFWTDGVSISGIEENNLDDFYNDKNRLNSGGRILDYLLTNQHVS